MNEFFMHTHCSSRTFQAWKGVGDSVEYVKNRVVSSVKGIQVRMRTSLCLSCYAYSLVRSACLLRLLSRAVRMPFYIYTMNLDYVHNKVPYCAARMHLFPSAIYRCL
jgi:hypothetical protein